MIDKKTKITYAQYNEDIIIDSLIGDIKKGFYVDIGANFSKTDSVTMRFYNEGWSGINVEPIKSLHNKLKIDRPRDKNLNIGIDSKTGIKKFREYTKIHGHSTFNLESSINKAKDSEYVEYEVRVKTLNDIFIEEDVKKIHFLKIDVEGYEYNVIAGNNWEKFRPEVLCIESNHVDKDWRPILLSNKYTLVIQDGLNEYYLANESISRFNNFAEIAVKNNYFALQEHYYTAWANDLANLEQITLERNVLLETNSELTSRIAKLTHNSALSLRGVGFMRRLKRVIYGLTIDYYWFTKNKK
jgi:FkbM family methyltransferase